MFIYWDGFEIDGSDTDFSIILPENVQVWEFVECFLSIPIFSNTPKPSVFYRQGNKQHKWKLVKLKEKVLAGDYPAVNIQVLCRHIEQLPENLRAEVYAISERRDPQESAYGKVENPCTTPVIEMTVELLMQQLGTGHGIDDGDEYGYIHNFELFRSANKENPWFRINVGPGFYYEYAIFIMDYLLDHFPGIGTCGGLDCGGGWTGGCTYADSIYYYERILMPVEYSTRNTLKRLTEYDIVRSWSYKHYDKTGWKYEYADGFCLAGQSPIQSNFNKDKPYSFAEYLELVDMVLELDADPFSMVCETAIRIMLPPVKEYAKNPEASRKLQAALPDSGNQNFTGYFAFTKIDGNPMAEFRVPYPMKKYLLTLFELAESGAIDFIKPVTWQRRQNQDE